VSQRLFGGGADAALPETGVLAATAIVSLGLTLFAPRCFPAATARATCCFGCCLWAAGHCRYPPVADARKAPCCRRRFRPLAFASVLSSGVSVLAVTVFPIAGGAGLVHSGHQPWRSRRALQALTVQASSSAQRSPRPAPAWRSHISAVSSRVGSLARPGLGTRDISASSAGTSAKSRSIASLP
jgi:hypothetical protein